MMCYFTLKNLFCQLYSIFLAFFLTYLPVQLSWFLKMTHSRLPNITIPQEILDEGYNKLVHVENWPKGCVFSYIKTENGEHHLITPKTRKIFKTKNNLRYTHRNLPQIPP